MAEFFAELKRRQMFRVAAAYAVVAWVLLQVVNNVAPVLDLPVWVARAFLLAVVIGFPIALLFVWMPDLAPADATAPRPATTKLDYVLAGGLVLVIALVSYQQLASSPNQEAVQRASIAPTTNFQSQADGISIAVLPFANLSGDAAQEFFSDGMTEEITIALAKVPGLRVVARASAFQFKGERRDMRAVGQALGARYLIDGSVRREADRIRIAAQLIQADSGLNVWADSYDRQLTGLFATQEDIAEAITGALRVPLGLRQGEVLVSSRTSDLESYQQYLRARALFRARDVVMAVLTLEGVVARDPNFAPAWGLLARAYELEPEYRTGSLDDARRSTQLSLDKAEKAAREAIRLDTRSAIAHAALATIEARRGRFAAAEDLFKHALSLDPNEPDVLQAYGSMLVAVGRAKDFLANAEQIVNLEPFVPTYNFAVAIGLSLTGQNERQARLLETLPQDSAGGFIRNTMLAYIRAEAGRYSEAADLLLAIRTTQLSRQSVEDAARLLRTAPARVSAPEALPILEGPLNFVYAHIGAVDRVMEYAERNIAIGANPTSTVWTPLHAPVRKTERFKMYARNAGLVDYWRARGWPDLCRPVGADDFVCD